jgi:CheY-like chemotaxis protein
MTRVLQRMGHEVRGFSNPRQALTVFERRPDDFDVVITDISMPDLSGFELAQALLRIRPQLAIIMTSGFVQAEERERALAIGVREVVLKRTIAELGHCWSVASITEIQSARRDLNYYCGF